jgi:hypothetical protein
LTLQVQLGVAKKESQFWNESTFRVAGVRDVHHRKIDPVLEELLCIPVLEDLT